MASEQDRENLFSEEIDHLLAGQATRKDQGADDDLLSALNFATKMRDLRRRPNPAFAAQLKSKLVRGFAAISVKEPASHGTKWFERLMPRSLVWQAAAFLVIFLVILGITWAAFNFIQNPPFGLNRGTPATGIVVKADASTDKAKYVTGDTVKIKVRLTNAGSEPLQIDQFPPLSLMQAQTKLPVYTFAATSGNLVLNPRTVAVYNLSWNQEDFKGNPVPPGNYYIELEDLDLQGTTVSLSLAQPVNFTISLH